MVRVRNHWQIFLMIVIATLAGALISPAQQPRRVNDALLKTGSTSGEEWVANGTNWAEQRYSPLKQIDVTNVSRLGLAWSAEIPLAAGNPQTHQENTPLVFNGVLYGITPWSITYAVFCLKKKKQRDALEDANNRTPDQRGVALQRPVTHAGSATPIDTCISARCRP